MTRLLTLIFVVISTAACLSQKQGISGRVLWVEGNQMPGPDRKAADPSPIVREIYIYEPVKRAQTKYANGLYSEINAPLVTTAKSQADGTFHVKLPPGKYSVFVREDGGFFANLIDGQGYINLIEVTKNQFATTTLKVNYKAFY